MADESIWRTTSACFRTEEEAKTCVASILNHFLLADIRLRVRSQPDQDGWWWVDQSGPDLTVEPGSLVHLWSSAHFEGQLKSFQKTPKNRPSDVYKPATTR